MNDISKKLLVMLPVSLFCAVFVIAISCLLLQDSAFVPAFAIGTVVFMVSEYFCFKIIEFFLPRIKSAEKSNFESSSPAAGNFEISSFLDFEYQVNSSATVDVMNLSDRKKMILVCDVLGSKAVTDVVQSLSKNTVEYVKNPENLRRTIRFIDSSVRGLKLNNEKIGILMILVDLDAMSLSYVNASQYDIFVSRQDSPESQGTSLSGNRFKMAAIPQSSFEVSECPVKADDVISVRLSEAKQ